MQNVEWVMGDTPQTITTTRAPAVLKIHTQNTATTINI